MGKTIICYTLAMSTVIIALYSSMVTTSLVPKLLFPFYPPSQIKMEKAVWEQDYRGYHEHVYMYRSVQEPKILHSSYMSTKNLISYGWNLFWCRVFITCRITAWPSPLSMVVYAMKSSIICARLSSRSTIACSTCYIQLTTTFTLNLEVAMYIATCCSYVPL